LNGKQIGVQRRSLALRQLLLKADWRETAGLLFVFAVDARLDPG
jgi:hypothetical protein